MFVTGLVLAAGGSRRLGRPKQLLGYRGSTLLGAALDAARGHGFDQLVVTLGGSADEVRAQVDLSGATVVENDEFGTGCGSSIAAALGSVDPLADGLVLLLGDQPEVPAAAVPALVRAGAGVPLAVCRYDDGVGHPFWFRRDVFGDLAVLHGDKAVWKLLEARDDALAVAVPGPVPIDVDTWEDYEALLAAPGGRP